MTQFVPLPPGIPFSWEKVPGVPRKQSDRPSYRSDSRRRDGRHVDGKLLPPPAAPCLSRKKYRAKAFARKDKDPFLDAFVLCTGPPDNGSRGFWIFARGAMGGRGRFALTGLNGHSCKRSCEVLDSVVYLGRTPSK